MRKKGEVMQAKEILTIPSDNPEKLFSNDLGLAKDEFHALGKVWHPDICKDPDASAVFSKISELYSEAKKIIGTVNWKSNTFLTFNIGGKLEKIFYYRKHKFELGDVYVGKDKVLYSIENQYSDLFTKGRTRIQNGFPFSSIRMEDEMSKYLPNKTTKYFSAEGKLFMSIPKSEDLVLLKDVIDSTPIEARHLGWIMNGIYNIGCYLNHVGIVHSEISPMNIFISPKMHSVHLLGGWWYASDVGSPLTAMSKRSVALCPPDILNKKKADKRLDLELIKALGREILGDIKGISFKTKTTSSILPKELLGFLDRVSTGDAVSDYRIWKNYLEVAYGKPKFIDFNVTAETIYGAK